MAIVQISQITNRKGLQDDLPQLAGAELGWSIDQRRLWIGNGTLAEGAPAVGNTEILTEFSDILAFQTNYTYKGQAAGYTAQTGPTASTPITQSLQSWLDQYASVKDFGATGDGITDDTDAINRALYQLYCREPNVQARRSLFFPAGVYRTTAPIEIPPYATLYGEGMDNSIIQLDSGYSSITVAQTADSLQQTGVNIGTNSATPPTYITISNLRFQNTDNGVENIFLLEQATNVKFDNVGFQGPLAPAELISSVLGMTGLRLLSNATYICEQITVDNCVFTGVTFGINTDSVVGGSGQQARGVTINGSQFDTLHVGISIGVEVPAVNQPTGFRITSNVFDNIYAEGIYFGAYTSLNATAHNTFYDVGNEFLGDTNPVTNNIYVGSSQVVCVGDMFARTDVYAAAVVRILIDATSIAFTNSSSLQMGVLTQESGQATVIASGASGQVLITVNPSNASGSLTGAFVVRYTIVRAGNKVRTGTITVANYDGIGLNWTDDYTENTPTGVTLTVSQSAGIVNVTANATVTAFDADFSYSLSYLN